MSTRWKLIVALVVVASVIGVLIRTAITNASTFYVTVPELYQEGPSAINQPVTVSGNIIGKSVRWDPAQGILRFSVQYKPGTRLLPVVFHGPRPDDFTNDWPVIVTGKMSDSGVFEASKLLIKCPSKYQAGTQNNTSSS